MDSFSTTTSRIAGGVLNVGKVFRQWSKVIGAGSFGVCGLLEPISDIDSLHGKEFPKFIVVKQSAGKAETRVGMMWESKLLREIMASCDTKHVVKLHRTFHDEGGTGTSSFDSLPLSETGEYMKGHEVSRMYLEYCKDRNLDNYMENLSL